MPVISMFYGIVIRMFHFDNAQHNMPHIHVQYSGGKLKSAKLKLVQAWIEIHRDDLMADWKLVVHGKKVFKIDPLR